MYRRMIARLLTQVRDGMLRGALPGKVSIYQSNEQSFPVEKRNHNRQPKHDIPTPAQNVSSSKSSKCAPSSPTKKFGSQRGLGGLPRTYMQAGGGMFGGI